METIRSWLNTSRDYNEGVQLYQKNGTNTFLKQRFQAGPDPYNKQKLAEELEKLVKQSTSPRKEFVETKKNSPPTSNLQSDQAQYLAMLRKRDDILRQLQRQMTVLDLGTEKKILHETAKQILKLHQKKVETWEQIDFFQENGSFEK